MTLRARTVKKAPQTARETPAQVRALSYLDIAALALVGDSEGFVAGTLRVHWRTAKSLVKRGGYQISSSSNGRGAIIRKVK